MSSVRAIVAAHAGLAGGLVGAVEAITGRSGVLRAVSNTGLGAQGVRETLAALLDETGAHVVFTDLPAGSCALAARKLQRDRPDLVVVTGVSLPVLLEFVVSDNDAPSAVEAAVARGREHLQAHGGNVG